MKSSFTAVLFYIDLHLILNFSPLIPRIYLLHVNLPSILIVLLGRTCILSLLCAHGNFWLMPSPIILYHWEVFILVLIKCMLYSDQLLIALCEPWVQYFLFCSGSLPRTRLFPNMSVQFYSAEDLNTCFQCSLPLVQYSEMWWFFFFFFCFD